MADIPTQFRRGKALAILSCGLAVLVWVAPMSEYPSTTKARLVATTLDAVITPLVELVGKPPLLIVLGLSAMFGLAHGFGMQLRLPRFRAPSFPPIRAPARDDDDVDTPVAPLTRRRGLAQSAYLHTEDSEAALPGKPPTAALEEQIRPLTGDDIEPTDDLADLRAEWERQGTPHGEHLDPIAIIRKPREKHRDWTGDRSWFGGLPRLGSHSWPRGKSGNPLPFAAQLDLAEIAAANPDTPLPKSGSLAFFINEGAVIYVPAGHHLPTPAPEDLPHAYDECSYPLPAADSPVTHPLFPFWPVEPIRMRMPDDLPPMGEDDAYYEAIEAAQQDAIAAIAPRSRYSFSTSDKQAEGIEGADTTWWYGADLVLRQLKAALASVPRSIASREKSIADAQAYRARLMAAKERDEAAIAYSLEFVERSRATIPLAEAEADGLATFIDHVEAFVTGRDPWSIMTAEEVEVLREIMETARKDYEHLCRYGVSSSIEDLRNATIRRMITRDQRAVAAMPDAVLALINENHRLPSDWQHQMFGLGGCRQDALYDHLCDHLLLQIVYDALPEFRFGDMGLWQFWIAPEHLAAGRWDKVQLTFECS